MLTEGKTSTATSIVIQDEPWKPCVQRFLWSQMGCQIRALSEDADGYSYIRNGPSWLVLTGDRDVAFLNLGFVASSTDKEYVQRKFTEELAERRLPAVLFMEADDTSSGDDEHVVPHMIQTEKMYRNRNSYPTSLPEGYSYIKIDDAHKLQGVIASQADAFEVSYDSLAKTMGDKLLNNTTVSTYAIRDENGRIVSSCMMVSPDGIMAGLWNMVTVPEHQNKGLGACLLAHATEELRMRGVQTFHLLPSGEDAQRFYEKHGYTTFCSGVEISIDALHQD